MTARLVIRPATAVDRVDLWMLLEPAIRGGETFAVPRDMTERDALAYWMAPGNVVFIAALKGRPVGTYFLRANQKGGGAHVANAAYTTEPSLRGRGIARAMLEHSLDEARQRGFTAMLFNFVVSSNERAVLLWESLGFSVVGRIPRAFRHPSLGEVDALLMYRPLDLPPELQPGSPAPDEAL